MNNFEKFHVKFIELLKELGYKNSSVKEKILQILFLSDKYLSAFEIQENFNAKFNKKVSLTAIYRFLNLLEELKFIINLNQNGVKKFSLNLKSHHDRIICVKCGKIVEFFDKIIEEKQDQICLNFGFKPQGHIMILHGVCKICQSK